MKRLDDQKIRDAFSENEEKPIGQDFEREDLWLRIEQKLPKSRKLHLNWYRSVAAILVLGVLSGWSITLLKYNQIRNANKQLTISIVEMESVLELQKKQIAESSAKPDKELNKIAENTEQLPEKRTGDDLLLLENKKLKAERESLRSTNALLNKQLNILSLENNRWADSLRLVTEKIGSPKEPPVASVKTPHESGRQAENKINIAYSPNTKTELYLSDMGDKRRGRRLKIQLFNPGEPVENNTANDVSIFKLFK